MGVFLETRCRRDDFWVLGLKLASSLLFGLIWFTCFDLLPYINESLCIFWLHKIQTRLSVHHPDTGSVGGGTVFLQHFQTLWNMISPWTRSRQSTANIALIVNPSQDLFSEQPRPSFLNGLNHWEHYKCCRHLHVCTKITPATADASVFILSYFYQHDSFLRWRNVGYECNLKCCYFNEQVSNVFVPF